MPQEYKDASYSLNTGIEGQVAPTLYSVSGVNNIYATTAVTAQVSTQSNQNTNPMATVTSAEQNLAVIGQVYNSPGGILNKAQNNGSTVTTGGGP